jgi:hypothetical protein
MVKSLRNFLAALATLILSGGGYSAEVRIYPGGAFHVLGEQDAEWRFEATTNFNDWFDAPDLGTMFSDAHPRELTNKSANVSFFRSVQTSGLFDDHALRTFHLKFTMSNWQALLDRARLSGSNVLCTLWLDNGLTNIGVGARYKGNSSFQLGGLKKSINLEFDQVYPDARLMGEKTINLNNAAGDETIMRESIYFTVMNEFAPSPKAAMARLFINGAYWGVYSLAQQENSVLIKEWFPSSDGDRWRTANIGSQSSMMWMGTNLSSYRGAYDLRTDNSTNAWKRLTNAIYALNFTPTNLFRTKIEEYFALDRWLWFLATENVFADEDSYVIKGADYSFYYEPESGRYHPIEHDGNEAFQPGDQSLSPVAGATASDRPLLFRTLRIPEIRQRYLAHMRTVLSERYNPDYLTPVIERLHRLSVAQITIDPKKNFTMAAYSNELRALKTFVTNRYRILTNHTELRPVPPVIESVTGPAASPYPEEQPAIRATVRAAGTNGVDSVWLYWRDKSYGWFHSTQMFDDGAHADGAAGDNVFAAAVTNYPAGTQVRYYIEARSANPAKAASFSPPRAEQVTYNFRVRTSEVSDSPIVINEFMAENRTTLADPQGEFEDWIELHNSSNEEVDLTGCYLSDDPVAPRKWQFPDGTKVAPNGYLIIWADEDGLATPGLHANFKLSNDGEQILLVDADERSNALLDEVTFGGQGADYSHGRDPQNPTAFKDMLPTPGAANQ